MQDFIIIGGGIAGLSAAAYLSALGSVTLLEAEENLGFHASSRSAALYEAHYGEAPTIELNKASAETLRAADVLITRGLLLIDCDPQADFDAERAAFHLDEISMQEARAKVPLLRDHVARAAYDPECWDIDTDRLMTYFAKMARAQGAQILTHSPVTALTKDGAQWRVTAAERDIHGACLVNAAGAWADDIARMAGIAPIGLKPLRRSMARLPAPTGVNVSDWPMVLPAGEAWYCKPDAGALIVSPADEDLVAPHDAYADDMVLAEGLARFTDHVDFPLTRMISNWAGLRSFAPDKRLVLGRDGHDPSFVWVAGQGGAGIQSSPAAGALIADLLQGRSPSLPDWAVQAMSPTRFERA